jgi:predicted nuclease with TOPRIM domain
MAETTKLSVEKALEKLRRSDSPKSKNTRLDEEVDALNEDIKRMRAQRQRLEQHRRKRD